MTQPMHQDAAADAVLRRTMVLLLLLLMFSLSSFPSVTADCPYKCRCNEEHIVDCYRQELNRIPDRISPATKILDSGLNEIRDIEPNSFTHLTELKELKLHYNKISNLKIGAFANLSKLQILYLFGNEIENIETGVFNNLTRTYKTGISNNKIRNIPPGIFGSLTSLSRLNINSNPLTCDCNMLLFANGLKKNYPHPDFFFNFRMSCYFPVEMRELSLQEITEIDFHCTSPDIIVVPENKTVSVGEQLQLSCKAVGDPEPFITWAKDDIDLELGQRVQVFQNNTLIISKVENTDGGQYKCVASNPLGRKSFEAMVNVNGLAENGCYTMFGVIPCFFFNIIALANRLLYNDIL
ncbi:unnamed protein product [Macrosiphum euphorbiae]|uniref:Ig-like domain-containing protein n=1 Tax=Macrosiphum euphorbiae TaxID=13131 RepID=A0AAV0XUA8_9HEMI|nr:unnamed protein product [Macrosiphum euphorbiae]